MNKRGDVPITILVIGVFAICVLTIFSFMFVANKVGNNFSGVGLIESVYATKEEVQFKQTLGLETEKVFENGNSVIEVGDNVITGNYSSNTEFFGSEKKTLFFVEYRFSD
jgi:hypothetical protein